MNTTAHPVAPEEVMALLDGELSTAEAQAVSAHLECCAECSALAEQFRGTSLSLSRWSVEAVPAKLENSVAGAANAGSRIDIDKAKIFTRASFWTWRQWATAGAGALAALLLVSAVFLPNLHRSRPSVVTQLVEPAEFNAEKSKASGRQVPQPNSPIDIGSSSAITLRRTSPAVAAGSYGKLPRLGDHVASSFSTDGQPATDQLDKVAPGPMIARTVSLSIVVKDFAASRSSLDSMLARHHGYSAQLNVSTPENAARSLQASLRIPAPELAAAIADLKTLGRVENESQSGEEVTQEHADLVARLKNSRETEQRLRSILQERTGKIDEVLEVEQEIARVRGEIERMEAEQKALEHRVDFATVELQLTEEYKAQLNPPAASVSTRIHNAFVAGYRDASETILGIVLFFAEDGPTLLIWLVILVVPVILVWRRYRRALATL
jgi:anti-sigma factor RsiW